MITRKHLLDSLISSFNEINWQLSFISSLQINCRKNQNKQLSGVYERRLGYGCMRNSENFEITGCANDGFAFDIKEACHKMILNRNLVNNWSVLNSYLQSCYLGP